MNHEQVVDLVVDARQEAIALVRLLAELEHQVRYKEVTLMSGMGAFVGTQDAVLKISANVVAALKESFL